MNLGSSTYRKAYIRGEVPEVIEHKDVKDKEINQEVKKLLEKNIKDTIKETHDHNDIKIIEVIKENVTTPRINNTTKLNTSSLTSENNFQNENENILNNFSSKLSSLITNILKEALKLPIERYDNVINNNTNLLKSFIQNNLRKLKFNNTEQILKYNTTHTTLNNTEIKNQKSENKTHLSQHLIFSNMTKELHKNTIIKPKTINSNKHMNINNKNASTANSQLKQNSSWIKEKVKLVKQNKDVPIEYLNNFIEREIHKPVNNTITEEIKSNHTIKSKLNELDNLGKEFVNKTESHKSITNNNNTLINLNNKKIVIIKNKTFSIVINKTVTPYLGHIVNNNKTISPSHSYINHNGNKTILHSVSRISNVDHKNKTFISVAHIEHIKNKTISPSLSHVVQNLPLLNHDHVSKNKTISNTFQQTYIGKAIKSNIYINIY